MASEAWRWAQALKGRPLAEGVVSDSTVENGYVQT